MASFNMLMCDEDDDFLVNVLEFTEHTLSDLVLDSEVPESTTEEKKDNILGFLENDEVLPASELLGEIFNQIEPSKEEEYLDFEYLLELEMEQPARNMESIPEDHLVEILDYQVLDELCQYIDYPMSEAVYNLQTSEVVQIGYGSDGNGSGDQNGSNAGGDIIIQDGEGRRPKIKPPLFTVEQSYSKYFVKYKMNGTRYDLQISEPDEGQNPVRWVSELINSIIDYYMCNSSVNVNPWDRVGMTLSNRTCGTEPVFISLRRADQLNADVVLDQIMAIFESNKEFFLNGDLTVNFDHIIMPHGTGRVYKKLGQSNQEFIEQKYSFITYANPNNQYPQDNYCLPYALVLAKAFVDNKKSQLYSFKRYISKLRQAAETLCAEANVRMALLRNGCSLDEVKKFQAVLPEYQIVIYLGLDLTSSVKESYTDSAYDGKKKLNILLDKNHYTAMSNVQACFASRFFCTDCQTRSDSSKNHSKCIYTCPCCLSKPPCQLPAYSDRVECSECLRSFRGSGCYINHKTLNHGKFTVCDRIKICPICRVRYHVEGEDSHYCCVNYCQICEKNETAGHECHMPLYTTKRDDGNVLYVVYDFETQQNTLLNPEESSKRKYVPKYKHIPNLCVVQTFCLTCKDIDDITKPCESCGDREIIYFGDDTVESLLSFLSIKANEKEEIDEEDEEDDFPRHISTNTRRNKFKKVIAMAHNSSGFDGQFILAHIYESDRYPNPKVIMKGTRVIQITLGYRVIFLDTLNYFQVGLSKLPELFGLEGTKGFYPHLYNTPDKIDYVGNLPAKSFYCPDSMSIKTRKEFDEWYDKQPADYQFINKKELVEYCRQDVNILRKSCVKFLNDFWESNTIDPFLDGSTIAGICNKAFRSNYLQADVIGIIPVNGYRFRDNQSKIALQWLSLIEKKEGVRIQHAGRGREKLITGIGRVDGFIDGSTFDPPRKDVVMEMLGCYWHGCETCFPIQYFAENLDEPTTTYDSPPHPENDSDERNQTMFMRREQTEERLQNIRDAGYDLVVMRECDFRRELKMKPEIARELENLPMIINDPLNPRDAFYGGRTNANNLYFKSDGETKMYLFDIMSLYPFIQKYKKSILGHGKIHVGDDCQSLPWQQLDGLMKVTVLPPRGLHFPVLPSKLHSLLMFHLCDTCARTLNKDRCEHSDEERSFTGTYVIDEMKLAIEKGYEIVKIHELWEYKVTQYDPVTKTGGLFTEYINHFLKIKAQASGYPKSCKTPKDEAAYIKEFYEREGVVLDPNKIKYNASLRQMAKIQLNSFWGRFGLRPDLVRTVVIKSYNELVNKIMNPKVEIHSVVPVNDDTMLLNYREIDDARRPNNTTNVVIAGMTTSYARMELYKYLDMLGPDRVYYYDTDSCIITARDGEIMPEVGNFLGMMTDELEKDYGSGSYITEFVAGSSKNYAFIVFTPSKKKYHTVVKVKGVTLNYGTSKVLNFDLIKKFVLKDEGEKLDVYTDSIRRTSTAEVYSTRVRKTYQVKYTKRQKIGSNYGTLPYGY